MSDVESDKLMLLETNCRNLQQANSTLLLSTLGEDFPEISYAPFVRDEEGVFYIFISELAAHTQNLLRNPLASVMFIADEEGSRNLFARERLTFKCEAHEMLSSESHYPLLLDKLEKKFGNVVGMLRSLPDFHLFCLRPIEGRYVVGFGSAYVVKPKTGELEHISEAVLNKP